MCQHASRPRSYTLENWALDYLRAIYVNEAEHAAGVESMLAIFDRASRVPCLEKPELFR